jgi:plastocyanin
MQIRHLLLPILLAASTAALADTPANLVIRNRAFEPSEVTVPAGQKIELHVRNEDSAASEFESAELHREKVVPAGKEVVVNVGPLRAGRYEFFDDFNPKARGHIVVK